MSIGSIFVINERECDFLSVDWLVVGLAVLLVAVSKSDEGIDLIGL
jgi:hypothetical protein